MKSLSDVKSIVGRMIQEHSYREITPETKYNTSGIYMIFIENCASDKIVPIYIGQSKDVQKRYKVHMTEILALNRLSYDEYYNYFFSKSSSFYEGRFKTCKIFKYMIDNNCRLRDFRVFLLEETGVEDLERKEQEYIQKLNASFFGFNQLNSFLTYLKLRRETIGMKEFEHFLRLIQEDIKGIYTYYDFGFTRFNFEHAFPKDFSFLIEEDVTLSETVLFKEVRAGVNQLLKHYKYDLKMSEVKQLEEKWSLLSEPYQVAMEEYNKEFRLLAEQVRLKFKELRLYSDNAFKHFLSSIVKEDKGANKEKFLKYLNSKQCDIDFYRLFDKQIAVVNEKLEEKEKRAKPTGDAYNEFQEKRAELKRERYKMIFPSIKFNPFSLGDRVKYVPLKFEEGTNTCHIQLFISNNGRSRGEYRKDLFIVRFEYCYIDEQGRRFEKRYYIENETTTNCVSGIEYIEKDFDKSFVFSPERFSLTGVIENEIDNSYISVLAEYRSGINDYTIREKNLVRLSEVLDELQQLVNDETVFCLENSESYGCLEKSLMNEKLLKHPFAGKLLKIEKRKKSAKALSKRVIQSSKKEEKLRVDPKIKRGEAFRLKVLERSNNKIVVLNYVSSKENVTVECTNCGHVWEKRSDHLLARPYCPECRK
jgi:hypothetical protein